MNGQKESYNLKEVIDFLLKSFKIERYIYLCVTIISIILLGILIYILIKNQEYTSILAMLGPAGLITFTFSRVLKMWTDCIDLIKTDITKK
jgi:hypothetical protein